MHMGAVPQLLLACAVNFVGRRKRKAYMNGFACSPKLIFEMLTSLACPFHLPELKFEVCSARSCNEKVAMEDEGL